MKRKNKINKKIMAFHFKKPNDSFIKDHQLIFKKYKMIKQIGCGSNGNIFTIERIIDNKQFALKTEEKKYNIINLKTEAYNLILIQGVGIPKFISFGGDSKYFFLIEELLGESFFLKFVQNKNECSIIDIGKIAIQILDRLEWIHSKNLLYMDVKPGNFLLGLNDPDVIYIIDFGTCQKYRSSKTNKHIQLKKTNHVIGTLSYVSSNVLKGFQASRRDDLISLGFMLIFILKKSLPWMSADYKTSSHAKIKEVIKLKETNDDGKIFKGIPAAFVKYMKYVQNLEFEEDPNYEYLRTLFKEMLFEIGNNSYKTLQFSWITLGRNIPKLNVGGALTLDEHLSQLNYFTENEKHFSTTNVKEGFGQAYNDNKNNLPDNEYDKPRKKNIKIDDKVTTKNNLPEKVNKIKYQTIEPSDFQINNLMGKIKEVKNYKKIMTGREKGNKISQKNSGNKIPKKMPKKVINCINKNVFNTNIFINSKLNPKKSKIKVINPLNFSSNIEHREKSLFNKKFNNLKIFNTKNQLNKSQNIQQNFVLKCIHFQNRIARYVSPLKEKRNLTSIN